MQDAVKLMDINPCETVTVLFGNNLMTVTKTVKDKDCAGIMQVGKAVSKEISIKDVPGRFGRECVISSGDISITCEARIIIDYAKIWLAEARGISVHELDTRMNSKSRLDALKAFDLYVSNIER